MSQSTTTHLQPISTTQPLPVDSAERLQALYDLDLLDTPPEANFDRLTAFACRLLNTSVSLVSLVDKDRQFFKSSQGVGEPWASRQETPLSHSFCQYVVSSNTPLIVEDAREDEILRDNLAIPDLNVVAYLGVPLFTEEGYVVGSLCAIEGKPRIWTPEELQTLQDLAALVMTEIRTRQYLKHQGEAREQLLKTNALLQGIIDSTGDGISVRDTQNRYLLVNHASAELVGMSAEEMIGKTYNELFPPEIAAQIEAEDRKTLETGKASRTEYTWQLGKATKVFDSTRYAYRDSQGNIIGILGVSHDITEQKKLLNKQVYHAYLLDNMHDAVIATDENFRITTWNRGAEQMYGWKVDEVLTRPVREIIRSEISEPIRQQAIQSLQTDGRYRMELVTHHKDGTKIPTEGITVALKDSDRQIIGYLSINRDIRERKNAELALQQSIALVQQQLVEIETLYATTPIGLAVLDRNLRYVRINNYLAANNGYTIEEHLGHTGAELIPEIATQLDPLLRNVLATGEPVINLEVSDGTPAQPDTKRTWLESFYPLRDPSGTVNAINIVVQEITERKQIEEALYQSTQQLRLITDNVPGLIAYIDRQECYRFVNAAYERWYNKPREQILGQKLSDFIHPDTYKIAQPYIAEALGGKTATFEVETNRYGRTTTWLMKYTPQIMDDGSVPGFYTLIMDISERKEAEAALLESQESFRVIFEQAAVGMAECDLNGNFVRVNTCLCEILGYSREELLEKETHVITHPDDLAYNQEQMQKILDGECDSYNLEKRYRRKDGTYLWVKVTVSLVKKLKTQEPDYFIRVIEDISEQKQYEQALEELNATLEQRVATRSKQLQTSNSKLLESESKLRQLSQQLMEMTEQERKRISREIHDQLGQSLTALKMEVKGAQRRLNTHPHETLARLDAANKLIDETVDTVRRIAADLRPGVLDHFGLGPAVEWLMAQFKERNQIDYVLDIKLQPEKITPNMATAAFRILQEALTNVVRHAQASQVHVTLRTTEEFMMKVQDNGSGLRENSTGRRSLGILGMSERAQQLGGSVTLSGEPGSGATVTLTLPIRQDKGVKIK